MKDLAKWQIISFASRAVAMFMGLIQSFIIVRILTVGEWGIVQLAVSIGGAFGIYQHLGLVSGSTREISSAKSDTEIFKIFLTGILIRYCVTIPISIFLFFGAQNIALSKYNDPALILPVKIYAGIVLLQGVQGLFNSVISGTKRFRSLFLYQALVSVLSVAIFVPFVYFLKINGYFYALLAFDAICSFILGYIAFRPLKGKIIMPTIEDFKRLIKELLSISLAIYAIKVIYTWWEKSGPLLLGFTVSNEMIGFFSLALLYAKKLMLASDSVTDVNLPVLSDKYVNDIKEFKRLFTDNFNKVYSLIFLIAITAVFWSKEFIPIAVGGDKYDQSLPLILPLGFAFIFYSLINIVTSSILIPAKMVKHMIAGFMLMLVSTVASYFVLSNFAEPMKAMAYGMVIGGFVGFVSMVVISRRVLSFMNIDHLLIAFQGLVISLSASISDIYIKFGLFVVFMSLYIWSTISCGFMKSDDLKYLVAKVGSKLKVKKQ
ncbi:MAG: oligosaccharide flippase family protein [Patescibacteria group bacterium]|jgi:O-antigen/teichoic acid export membrane protein